MFLQTFERMLVDQLADKREQLFPDGDHQGKLLAILNKKYERVLLEQGLAKSLTRALENGSSHTYSLPSNVEETDILQELLAKSQDRHYK